MARREALRHGGPWHVSVLLWNWIAYMERLYGWGDGQNHHDGG